MRYAFHGLTLDSALPLPELRRARPDAGPAAIAIVVAETPFADRVEWFHHWGFPRGVARRRPWLSFGRCAGRYLLRFQDLADFRVSRAGDRVECAPRAGCPAVTLRHLLLDQILPLVLGQRGWLVLHASAVHVNGYGTIAFAGRAGSGKSTLAAALALRGCSIVADDSMAIAGSPDAPVAVPAYPGLRLWGDAKRQLGLARARGPRVAHYTTKKRLDPASLRFRTAPSPLRMIFVIGRRSPTRRPVRARALRPRDRLMALARFAFIMDVEDRRQLSATFASLVSLIDRVRIERLHVAEGRGAMRSNADEVLSMVRAAAAGR